MNNYLKRIITLLISLTMLVGLIPVNAAWDGYPRPEVGDEIILVSNQKISEIIKAKAAPSKKHTLDGGYTAHWANHPSNGVLTYTNVERDWSNIEEICFDIYSEKATGGLLVFMVYADYVPTPGKTISYFKYDLKINFEGWKSFKLNPADFTNGNYADWAKINKVDFITNGWSATPHPESDLYISSVRGVIGEQDIFVEGENKFAASDEAKKAVYEILGDSKAFMEFGCNYIEDGKMVTIDVNDAINKDENGSMAPLSFFSNILHADVKTENNKVSVALDGKSADVTDMVIDYEGVQYLPLNATLSKLGKTSKTKDMVTIIGDEKTIDKALENASALNTVKLMLNENILEAKEIAKEDWKFMKDKWRSYLYGDETTNDLTNEIVANKIKSYDIACESAWKSMNKNTEIRALFGNKEVTVTSAMSSQYFKLTSMAQGYATYGCKNYKNPELLKDIIFALDWLNENLYGMDEINGNGWESIRGGDWWDWYVGVPQYLVNVLFAIENEITPKQVEKYLTPFEELRKVMEPAAVASKIYVCTASAALREDFDDMNERNNDFSSLLMQGEGTGYVQEDWLYITHGYFPYSAAYGSTSLLDRLVKIESILSGTKFEFATPYKYNSCKWMYETFAPIMFNGVITSSQSGRFRGVGHGFSEENYIYYAVAAMLDLIGAFGKDDDAKLKQLIHRNVIELNMGSIIGSIEIDQAAKLAEVMADTSIEGEPYYKGKVYYTGDSVMQQRDDFGFAISMSSERMAGWESISGQNMHGWYQGDGMLYTYNADDPLAYNRDFWVNSNPYHLPGTTVDTQERLLVSIKDSSEALTHQDFVGGVEMEEEFVTAAMQLESYHKDNPNAVTSDVTPGGDAPNHKSTLMAKKSWFLFDDEAVALGADIDANDGFEVQTVVENRKLLMSEDIVTEEAKNGPQAYNVVAVTGDNPDALTPLSNMIDNDFETRWSAAGDAIAIFELEEAVPIGYVGIAQYNGTDGKQGIFEIEISTDGTNWTQVWGGKASGQTKAMEPYDLKGVVAKYVKYNGHGRTNSEWNSITEVKIYAPTADGSMPVATAEITNKLYGTEKVYVDGNLLEKAATYTKEFNNPKWINIEGTGGYFFPQGGKMVMDKVFNVKPFLEFWFTHGKNPKDATYSYVVLPKKSPEETEAYAKNPDIEILSNTKDIQSVKEKNINATGTVFWKEGTFNNITVSNPMIVMTKENSKEFKVNICDPTQKLSYAKVTIVGNYDLVESDERCTVKKDGNNTVIEIDFEGSKGRTLPIILKSK